MTDFVGVIGLQRVIRIGVLAVLNVVLFAAWFFWLTPSLETADMNMAEIDGQLAELHASVDTFKGDKTFMQDNQAEFEKLKASGFFEPQDRFKISRQLEDMRKNFRIIGFSYDIGDTEITPGPQQTETSKLDLVSSDIKFESMQLYTDMDLYAFINSLGHYLPGNARVQSLELKRTAPVSEEEILNVMSRRSKGFFEANMTVKLVTMSGLDEKGGKTQ